MSLVVMSACSTPDNNLDDINVDNNNLILLTSGAESVIPASLLSILNAQEIRPDIITIHDDFTSRSRRQEVEELFRQDGIEEQPIINRIIRMIGQEVPNNPHGVSFNRGLYNLASRIGIQQNLKGFTVVSVSFSHGDETVSNVFARYTSIPEDAWGSIINNISVEDVYAYFLLHEVGHVRPEDINNHSRNSREILSEQHANDLYQLAFNGGAVEERKLPEYMAYMRALAFFNRNSVTGYSYIASLREENIDYLSQRPNAITELEAMLVEMGRELDVYTQQCGDDISQEMVLGYKYVVAQRWLSEGRYSDNKGIVNILKNFIEGSDNLLAPDYLQAPTFSETPSLTPVCDLNH